MTGRLVRLSDVVAGCERILKDEFNSRPEKSLYMIGGIDEVPSCD